MMRPTPRNIRPPRRFKTKKEAEEFLKKFSKPPPRTKKSRTAGPRGHRADVPNPDYADYKAAKDFVEKQKKKNLTPAKRGTKRNDDVVVLEQEQAVRRKNTQALLFTNLRKALDHIATNESRPQNYNMSGDCIPYHGSPELIVSKMTNPSEAACFMNATPAQLGHLQPLLRFFIVDGENNQREVYFSDHVKQEKLLELAYLRRQDSALEMLAPRDQRGTNVGIKNFTWQYDNKNYGHYVLNANMEMYFGSLTELVNENYLSFIFTTGNKRMHQPAVVDSKKKNKAQKLQEMKIDLDRRLKDLQVQNISRFSHTERRPHKDSTLLKVICGYSVPAGDKSELMKSFESPAEYECFMDALDRTQRVLTLYLKSYEINFSQEGTVSLTMDYSASTGVVANSPQSDVLGDEGNSQLKNTRVFLRTENYGKKDTVFPKGYLATQIKQTDEILDEDEKDYESTREKDEAFPVLLSGIEAEIEYLELWMERREFVLQDRAVNAGLASDKAYQRYKKYLETAYQALEEAQVQLRGVRYATFMEKLIQSGRIWVGHAYMNRSNATANLKSARGYGIDFSPPSDKDLTEAAKRANAVAKSAIRSLSSDKDFDDLLTRQGSLDPYLKAEKKGAVPIYFFRFGDLIDVAMESSGIGNLSQGPIRTLLGSFAPGEANSLPGFSPDTEPRNVSLYDIPISIEFYGKWFVEHVVRPEIDRYPFARFLNDAIKGLLSSVLNDVCADIRLNLSISYTVIPATSELSFSKKILAGGGQGTLIEGGANFAKTQRPGESPEEFEKRESKIVGSTFIASEQTLSLFQRTNSVAAFGANNFIHLRNYYCVYAEQTPWNSTRTGNRKKDEEDGIYHFVLGANRGLAKEFNFEAMDSPYFKEMNIEKTNMGNLAQALILPQNVSLSMVGNTLLKNGDLIYINTRSALGAMASDVLAVGGYYRVYRSTHSISPGSYNTVVDCKFQRRTRG